MPDRYNVLVVYKDREGANNIRRLLEDNLKVEVMMDWQESLEAAEPRIQSYDLAVVSVDLHSRSQGLVGPRKSTTGLELLHRLSDKGITTPVVLVSVSVEDKQLVHEVQASPSVFLAVLGVDFDHGLIEGARTLLRYAAEHTETQEKRVYLDFSFTHGRHVSWILSGRKGVTLVREEIGDIILDEHALERLKYSSKTLQEKVESKSDWDMQLKYLSDELTQAIFSNLEFSTTLYDLLSELGGRDNLRIRFVVEEEAHSITLEALRDYPKQQYWMLEAPIVRRLNRQGAGPALFQVEDDKTRPLNCLIIDAFSREPAGVPRINGPEYILQSIPNARDEANWLTTELMKAGGQWRTGRIARIRGNKNGGVVVLKAEQELDTWHQSESMADSFHAAIEAVLTEKQRWDIVHYAGHSFYDRIGEIGRHREKTGYVFFPDDPVDTMDAETFAKHLLEAKVKLLYLSSCHSSDEGFVFRMAEQHIPAVIGFRWDIDDEKAFEFTKVFYSSLCKQLSLEDAFLAARQQLNKVDSTNPIWASPMLVLQVATS